jgi:hypothetical protein
MLDYGGTTVDSDEASGGAGGAQGRTDVMATGGTCPTQISGSNELLILITVDIKDH